MGRYSKDPNEVPWNRHNPVVPFIDGEMQGTTFAWSKDVVWTPVPPTFTSPMNIVGYERGQSTITVKMWSPTLDKTYRVSVDSLFSILEKSQVILDEIPEHDWQFYKQGDTFLLKVVL